MQRPHRIAVTGASGFIGAALVRHLVSLGHEVIALSRAGSSVAGARNLRVDGYSNALVPALRNVEVVFHLAARAHQAQAESDAPFADNLASLQAVALACRTAAVQRLVLMSSAGVQGNRTLERPFTEDDTAAPVEGYARSKLACERWLRQAFVPPESPEWVIVRPPLVYGPGAPGNFARLLRALQRGWPLPLACVDNRRSLVALDNLVDFLVCCAGHPQAAGQVFLVADSESLSTPELLRRTARSMQRPCRLWPVLWTRLCASLELDTRKASTLLGWTPPIGVDEGLRRAVQPPVS